MLDAEAVADYEAWKQKKILGSQDLSLDAYNLEHIQDEGAALAYDAGVDAAFSGIITRQNAADVKAASPYRGKGTAGERRRITS